MYTICRMPPLFSDHFSVQATFDQLKQLFPILRIIKLNKQYLLIFFGGHRAEQRLQNEASVLFSSVISTIGADSNACENPA